MFNHSLFEMVKEYNNNREIIETYLKGHKIEGVEGGDTLSFLGMSIAIFLTMLILNLVIWIWAIVILVKRWEVVPDWARIIGIIGILPIIPFGPVFTLVTIYMSSNKKKKGI
jgi:hypothetical protein